MACTALWHEGTVGAWRNFEVEDVRSIALIEDEENLSEMTVPIGGFNLDDLVDARFEERKLLVGHCCLLSR